MLDPPPDDREPPAAAAAEPGAPTAAERKRAMWREAKRRRRQRERDGERVALVRYNSDRLNTLVRGRYLAANAVADRAEIGRAVERMIDHTDIDR
jgi:hypothetical protein